MTCEKCKGNGFYYSNPMRGVYEIKACLCESSRTIREFREKEYQKKREYNLKRLAEAKKRFGMAEVVS